ncbi:hypothetical protein CDAR_56441 [Caerostris darwini]|uniref:Uncharacterized protein n=1 Tax=Caerostris darwini TaxID=1538125 RepID=A0AAV4N768_9ARAC|nr:hypothetical protein CDAR_56441 [Caerostris darwini]
MKRLKTDFDSLYEFNRSDQMHRHNKDFTSFETNSSLKNAAALYASSPDTKDIVSILNPISSKSDNSFPQKYPIFSP